MIENDRYKLYLGDCLEIMDMLIEEGVRFDAIITDIPYGTTNCKWDSVIPFEPMWERLNKLIKPNCAICLFGSEPFSSALRMSNIKSYKYDWIWNKVKPSGHLNAKIMPLKQHEIVSVFGSGKTNYYPIMEEQKPRVSKNYLNNKSEVFGSEKAVEKITAHKYPKTILTFSNANQKCKYHPTEKNIALLEYLVKSYTNENDLILDFTCGSGSTGVACLNTNRKFIGIELEEKYFEIAKERMELIK